MPKRELFDASQIKPKNRARKPAAMPVDIMNDVHHLSEYMEIPFERLVSYRRKDPYDIVDTEDPEYQALVISISENGVYDAIIVRPINDNGADDDEEERFEILAGHHRVEASKQAGKKKVPARVIVECTDDEAEDIYRISNLLRKKQSIRDLAYGWWHYFQATRYSSEEEINKLISQGIVNESFKIIKDSRGNKQLRRYARLHELTDEMMQLVEKGLSIKFAEQISFISKDKQNDLLVYQGSLKGEDKAKELRKLAEGGKEGKEWNKQNIEQILFPNSLPSEGKGSYSDSEFVGILRQSIPKEYQEPEQMLSLIQEALDLYFKQNPETQN